jgi:GSH-dependent disulfide-bond oxidoreductase
MPEAVSGKGASMIDLYMAPTTNSRRASIGLSEAGLPYKAHRINLRAEEQRSPEHLARNPYGKVPVIVDPDGIEGKPVTIFESGAILLYAAEKSRTLYGKTPADRVEVQKWFMLHMSGSVPFLSALKNHPTLQPECERILRVIDNHLSRNRFFASEFSIADICFYPRVAAFDASLFPISSYNSIKRWIGEVGVRPGVIEGMSQP